MNYDDAIDAVFPKAIHQPSPLTMQQLADYKAALKGALPQDTTVQVTLLMQTVQLSVWIPGHGWKRRAAEVSHDVGAAS